jgi:2-polyprenyl-3-methyl-5-hydroxy-6-metoxy-1,4-benzoquinol methylase
MNDIKSIEQTVAHCYSTWGTTYFNDYYGEKAPYPPVHVDLVRKVLKNYNSKTIIDAGCGPASFLRGLFRDDFTLYGFDLTPEMVAEGKRVFAEQGLNPDHLWEGSIIDEKAYIAPDGTSQYDAAVSCGVMPHIPQELDKQVFERVYSALKSGGIACIEARNELFSLFTMNRYSYSFMVERLIQPQELSKHLTENDTQSVNNALDEMQKQFMMNLPPIRKGKAGEPGYDEVLSRTHNPFELSALAQSVGFKNVHVKFYHYHAVPPMFAKFIPESFIRESVRMEDPDDWRGYFMASAFFVIGEK